jgi:hypothetical protein
VGASLFAKTAAHSKTMCLQYRFREQARSHAEQFPHKPGAGNAECFKASFRRLHHYRADGRVTDRYSAAPLRVSGRR